MSILNIDEQGLFGLLYIIIWKSNLGKDFQAKEVPFNLISTMELLGYIILLIQMQ